MKEDQLVDLAKLSGMMRDRDLSAVEKIVVQMKELEADIARIREVQDRRMAEDRIDTARISGLDPVWLKWGEERLARLNGELARLRAAHETALRAARRSFGRAEVTRTLLEETRRRDRKGKD